MLNSALPTGNVIINLILYFMSQFMFKQDLAESAGKLLAREIHTNEPLMAELSRTAYSPQRKLLSPKQIQIIFSFLGEP